VNARVEEDVLGDSDSFVLGAPTEVLLPQDDEAGDTDEEIEVDTPPPRGSTVLPPAANYSIRSPLLANPPIVFSWSQASNTGAA
jgi:hypothetical protein